MKVKSFYSANKIGIIVFTIIVLSFSCKPGQQISSGIFTFTVGDVTLNGKSAGIGDSVVVNDTIQTGNKSFAVIQFGNISLLKLHDSSSVKVISLQLSEKDEIKLFMEYGNTFNKLVKKGSGYTIKTPTMIAAVRGTSFSVIQKKDSESGRCLVLEGSVAVEKTYAPGGTEPQKAVPEEQKKEPIIVQSGYQVKVSEAEVGAPFVIERSEKSELVKLKEIRIIEELPKAEPQERKEIIIKNPVIPESKAETTAPPESKDKVPDKENTVAVKTAQQVYQEKLNEIKVRNRGKLDKITLKDGRSFLGMIIERGLLYKIETPKGIQLIQQEEIVTQTIQY